MFRGRKVREGGWYIKKPYAHFDLPMSFDIASARVSDPGYVASKAFWPFVGFNDTRRRFRTKNGAAVVDKKVRPLKYCSHHDGYIYSFYAQALNRQYEALVRYHCIDEVVLAYRRGLGSNVAMAKAAFDEIAFRENCCVIALDIESFFDSIDHDILKDNLCEVLALQRLPADWYAIFKSMTRYSWVDLDKLAVRLGFDAKDPPRPFCDAKSYREIVRRPADSLVEKNVSTFGIPQGSPLSAVFSNIYMLKFDIACKRQFDKSGIYYRRYSDDILIVCDEQQSGGAFEVIKSEIAKLGPAMKVNDGKTEISIFKTAPGQKVVCDFPVTYLGLSYDGGRTLLRNRTISRYYRRMTYAVRSTLRGAEQSGSAEPHLRSLYRDMTHLGRRSFYSYARFASKVLGAPGPLRQLRRHVRILYRKLGNQGK